MPSEMQELLTSQCNDGVQRPVPASVGCVPGQVPMCAAGSCVDRQSALTFLNQDQPSSIPLPQGNTSLIHVCNPDDF